MSYPFGNIQGLVNGTESVVYDYTVGTLIPGSTGTIIGDMTYSSQQGKAFDGVNAPGAGESAVKYPASGSAYIGKDWGVGNSRAVAGVIVRAAWNMGGFNQGDAGNITITLRGSDDGSSWTTLATLASGVSGIIENAVYKVDAGLTATAYRYHSVLITNTTALVRVGEVEFYSTGAKASIDTAVDGNTVTLNGDEDAFYTYILYHVGVAEGLLYPTMIFNNDSSALYGFRGLSIGNTTVGNWSGTAQNFHYVGGVDNGQVSFSVLRMSAKSGMPRFMDGMLVENVSGTTVNSIYPAGWVYNETGTNITRAKVGTTGTTGLGIGTRLIILKSNNFSGGVPCGSITAPSIKGSWVRVGSQTLSSPANNLTISGLNGNRDVLYLISIFLKGGANGAAYCGAVIQPNSDNTDSYGFQLMRALNTAIAAWRTTTTTSGYDRGLAISHDSVATDRYEHSQMILFAPTGNARVAIARSYQDVIGDGTGSASGIKIIGSVWKDTANNITDLYMYSNNSKVYAAGTTVEVYALRPAG